MPSSTTSSESPARPRVLLVDDNPAMLSRAARVLASACQIVGTAHDGVGALAAAASLMPDVIVLDISMPGMSGFEVAAELRERRSTAAVVFLTVHFEEEILDAAEAAGGIGYVVKPRLASDLTTAVLSARDHRRFV